MKSRGKLAYVTAVWISVVLWPGGTCFTEIGKRNIGRNVGHVGIRWSCLSDRFAFRMFPCFCGGQQQTALGTRFAQGGLLFYGFQGTRITLWRILHFICFVDFSLLAVEHDRSL